jgi:hypothetical protein
MMAAAADMLAAFFRKSRLPSLTTGCSLLGGRLSISLLQKKTASDPKGWDAVVQVIQTKMLRRRDLTDAPLRRLLSS